LFQALLGGDVDLKADDVPIRNWIRDPSISKGPPGEPHEVRLTVMRSGSTIEIPITVTHQSVW
jgi:S1-C subfamily serine protease